MTRIQRRAVVGAEGGAVGGDIEQRINNARGGGRSLPDGVRGSMEQAFGADLSAVRVHADGEATALSESIQAEAFTIGSDIFFRGGMPDVAHGAGQELLAHELAHTVQQSDATQRRIGRKYLDEKTDWVNDTSFVSSSPFKKNAGRSKEMKAIDDAVAEWDGRWKIGLVTELIASTVKILAAIGVWETKKGDAATAMRGTEVGELKTETTQWQTKLRGWRDNFPARQAKHNQDRATVNNWIDEGLLSNDQRLRNACEWVRSNKMQFFVVTETADNKERAAAILKKDIATVSDDARSYFPNPRKGAGALKDPVALYNWQNFRDANNVTPDLEGRGTKGWNLAGSYIVVTEEGVADGKAEVWGTLKHEVQHDADKNRGTELNAGVVGAEKAKTKAEAKYLKLQNKANKAATKLATTDNLKNRNAAQLTKQAFDVFETSDDYALRDLKVASETALRRYKTEYRAHFYEGSPKYDTEPHNTKKKITREGMKWTRRQWKIFSDIRTSYGYVETAWGPTNAAPTALQLTYRNAVLAYVNPDTEGFNKYDSVRIDDLYNALHAVPEGTTDVTLPTFKALLTAAGKLNLDDIDYLLDAKQSVMLRAKIKKHLKGAARDAFFKEVDELAQGMSITALFA